MKTAAEKKIKADYEKCGAVTDEREAGTRKWDKSQQDGKGKGKVDLWTRRDGPAIREAPLKFTRGAFGHCPFSFCTPPPALKRALWGTFFRDDLSNFFKSPF